jgi:ribonuclease P/MRP protein subunit POP3
MLKSEQKDTQSDKLAPKEVFSVIFVSQTNQSGILHAQIPQLVATASLAYPDSPATRLIQLYKGSEERLCDALGIPRVSCVGIFESAPFSISLIDLIRECVPPMEIAWLKEAMDAKYLPLKVNSIQTFAPVGKKS